MATRTYLGRALATAQVDKLTVGGTIEADDIFKITINGKTLAVTGGATDADDCRDAIVTAFNAATATEFAEITAAAHADTGALTLTHDTAGVPFTATVTTTEANGDAADAQTFTTSTTTAATGPYHYDDANNWSGGAVPVDGDSVVFSGQYPAPCRYGIAQESIEIDTLAIEGKYLADGGEIGLPSTSATGSYSEYRQQYLALAADTVKIGQGGVNGSTRVRLDLGGVDATVTVFDTGASNDNNIPACLIKSTAGQSSSDGTPSSTSVEVLGGNVGLALYDGDDFVIDTLTVSGGSVIVGADATLTNATISATADIRCGVSGTLTIKAGETTVQGDGVSGTLNIDGGTCYYESTQAPSATTVDNGVLDLSRDISARTMALTLGDGGSVNDPHDTRSGAITRTGSVAAA